MSRHVMWNRHPWGLLWAGWLLPENVFVCFCFWSAFLWMSNSTLAAVFLFCTLNILFHCFLAFVVSLRSYVKSCGYSFGGNVPFPLWLPFKIFRLSLVLSRLSVIDLQVSCLCFFVILESVNWYVLSVLAKFLVILSSNIVSATFYQFFLSISPGMRKDNLFLAFSVLHVLQWNQCVSCLSVLHSGYFHLIFLQFSLQLHPARIDHFWIFNLLILFFNFMDLFLML